MRTKTPSIGNEAKVDAANSCRLGLVDSGRSKVLCCECGQSQQHRKAVELLEYASEELYNGASSGCNLQVCKEQGEVVPESISMSSSTFKVLHFKWLKRVIMNSDYDIGLAIPAIVAGYSRIFLIRMSGSCMRKVVIARHSTLHLPMIHHCWISHIRASQ